MNYLVEPNLNRRIRVTAPIAYKGKMGYVSGCRFKYPAQSFWVTPVRLDGEEGTALVTGYALIVDRTISHNKGLHRYSLRYEAGEEQAAADAVMIWLNNPSLNFDSADAMLLQTEIFRIAKM